MYLSISWPIATKFHGKIGLYYAPKGTGSSDSFHTVPTPRCAGDTSLHILQIVYYNVAYRSLPISSRKLVPANSVINSQR